jgi:hydrogenase maturation protease
MAGRVVVAGYGNPLRRDDGAGWRVAAEVAERWGDRATVLLGQQPVPEWVEILSSAESVYFVDAALNSPNGATVRRLKPGRGPLHVHTHAFGPDHLLAMTQALFGRTPRAYLVLVPASDFGFGEQLSPTTARAAKSAVRLIGRRLAARQRMDSRLA